MPNVVEQGLHLDTVGSNFPRLFNQTAAQKCGNLTFCCAARKDQTKQIVLRSNWQIRHILQFFFSNRIARRQTFLKTLMFVFSALRESFVLRSLPLVSTLVYVRGIWFDFIICPAAPHACLAFRYGHLWVFSL